jgi:hypothetical protein
MAGEITVIAALQIRNGNFELAQTGASRVSIDQTGVGGGVPGTVTVGVTEQDIDLSALTTLGIVRIVNLDTTNYVTWGPKDGSGNMLPIGRLKPGEPALFRLEPGITLRMIANTAACKVQILANEN